VRSAAAAPDASDAPQAAGVIDNYAGIGQGELRPVAAPHLVRAYAVVLIDLLAEHDLNPLAPSDRAHQAADRAGRSRSLMKRFRREVDPRSPIASVPQVVK
jgi:hypothetical protein